MHSHIDYGYPWQLFYGHLIIAVLTLPLFVFALKRDWSKWIQGIVGLLALWSSAAFLVVYFGFGLNRTPALPTESFLKSGSGKVLDMGAGTGRSAIMVLQARPNATLVALDQFGTSYEQHFGESGTQQQILDAGRKRLIANFESAGVDLRATIQPGDMRKMPLETASFDGVVSAYAIDHLRRDGRASALGEAARVLKPGGDFLLIVLTKDFWMKFLFGPLMLHSNFPSQQSWVEALGKSNFTVTEMGTSPVTLYFLSRRN